MGYYTWTVANRKEKKTKDGWYSDQCKLAYGGYGAVITPDNKRIEIEHYAGYGIFGREDVYEMVVDWNRDYLKDIFKSMATRHPDGFWGCTLKEIAEAYQMRDKKRVAKLAEDLGKEHPFLRTEWKRNIGITIACYDEDNDALPFPIKIVDSIRSKPYAELHVSHSCQ